MKRKDMAKQIMSFCKKGKVRINGEKVRLDKLADESVKLSSVSFLSSLDNLSKCDDNERKPEVPAITTALGAIQASYVNDAENIVVVLDKKKDKSFDFMMDGTLGDLIRSSNLSIILKKLKSNWGNLCNKDDNSPVVAIIPNIYVFIDPATGKLLNFPFKVNLTMIAESPFKRLAEEVEVGKDTVKTVVYNVVADVFDVMLRSNVTDFVFSPYEGLLGDYEDQTTQCIIIGFMAADNACKQFNKVVLPMEEKAIVRYISVKKAADKFGAEMTCSKEEMKSTLEEPEDDDYDDEDDED